MSAGLGDPVSQDAFVFTVNSMECGISQVGSDLLGEEAQGQYCKISVSVENAGNEAEYFSADSQVVYDDQGREFEADTGAMKIPVVEIHCKASQSMHTRVLARRTSRLIALHASKNRGFAYGAVAQLVRAADS